MSNNIEGNEGKAEEGSIQNQNINDVFNGIILNTRSFDIFDDFPETQFFVMAMRCLNCDLLIISRNGQQWGEIIREHLVACENDHDDDDFQPSEAQ